MAMSERDTFSFAYRRLRRSIYVAVGRAVKAFIKVIKGGD